jgi:hypothetical protein
MAQSQPRRKGAKIFIFYSLASWHFRAFALILFVLRLCGLCVFALAIETEFLGGAFQRLNPSVLGGTFPGRLPKVHILLQSEPKFRRGIKQSCQPVCHVRAYATFFRHNFVDRSSGHPK